MHRNKSVSSHQFAMVPKADIPRSSFSSPGSCKTTFDAGYLVPVYCREVLPGDTFKLKMTAFCRLATPINPIMDNLIMDSFFFFVPNRLVWTHWKNFMGEKANPSDSTVYTVPTHTSPANGYAVGSLQSYFGLPIVGQVTTSKTVTHNALPIRAYNLIWNEWFRDQNMQNSATVDTGDSGDSVSNYVLLKRGKRHDYFTSCLPWPQKGTAVSLPLGTTAAVKVAGGNADYTYSKVRSSLVGFNDSGEPSNFMYADLSAATAATINDLRQSFQIQKLLERDARGGTRYTEIIRSHFGVVSPDARLQRPEYLGGGSTRIAINPVAQTSGTSASGTTTPLGNLAAFGTALASDHGFTQSFTEHGYIIGLVNVRADMTYQQGLHKMWSRSTRYDFYFPAFACLGEQSVLNSEIYFTGDTGDSTVFGYQERWAEYRYGQKIVTGLFNSAASGAIDNWHLAQKFTSAPTLNDTFISETPPLSRVLAVGASADGKQLLFDGYFDVTEVRCMPTYSVPGLIDHF